jgi:raffinose/stachyose/melibiose transport system permease protein/N-acetylglucosamine transport system permease protein
MHSGGRAGYSDDQALHGKGVCGRQLLTLCGREGKMALFGKEKGYDEAYFKKAGSQKAASWVLFAFFLLYVITLLYPFLWIGMNSFKSAESFAYKPNSALFEWNLRNYADAFMDKSAVGANLFTMLFNSVFIVTASTLITILTSCCTAYIMAKFSFKGKSLMFSVIVFAMILPIVGTLPSLMDVMQKIKLYNTYWVLLFLYSGGMGGNFILLYSFFKNISWQYAEAAYIDGASNTRVFFSIMIPLALPAIVSVALLTWIGLWGEYLMPSVLLPKHPTIAVGLYEITSTFKGYNDPRMFASVIVAILPILVVFVIFQKTIMTNTVAGGLKG